MSNQAEQKNPLHEDEASHGESDDFALTMPEFRVPDEAAALVSKSQPFVDEPTGEISAPELDEPSNDHDFTRVETETEKPTLEQIKTTEMQPLEFDRSELVKTVQMDSFDRSIERPTTKPVEVDQTLSDQRFAPDILVQSPRVLTENWQDGAATESVASGNEHQRETAASMADTIAPGSLVADSMSEAEALDLDSPDLVVEEIKPQPPKSPPKPVRQPFRSESHVTPPGTPTDDDDLSGIVQELLEEKRHEEPAISPEEQRRQNWCIDLFDEDYLRTLPRGQKRETVREVKLIVESLGLKPQARVLDLACGFGRHSVQLAEAGFEVAGLDLSMVMLQHALSEAQRRNLSIKFVHGDMRELNFSQIFDGCFSWQTSFGYFDDATNLAVLRGVHESLKPGGRFLLDVLNRDHLVPKMPARTWWEGIECVFLEEVEFDYTKSILQTKRSFLYEDGSPPRECWSYIRLYGLHELQRMLETAGFRVLEVSGETHHRGAFLGAASSKLIVLAEKL